MTTPLSLGALLKEHRTLLGWSQQALAEEVQVSRELIAQIETGRARPSRPVALSLADHLGLAGPDRTAFLALSRGLPPALPPPDPLAVGDPTRPAHPALPWPRTPLLGRTLAITTLRTRLAEPGVRLVTLTGPPGVGKTRLALAVATAVLPAYPGGVDFVPLADLADPAALLPTLAQHLALPPADPAAFAAALGPAPRLLVLDTADHLLAAAPTLAALLAAAPALTLLVTSRAALHLYGEHEYPVPPLALPPPGPLPPFDDLGAYAAVGLFVQRVQAVRPAFLLTDANAAAVVALCTHLDGLPLPIELAAAWGKFLSPAAILARVERQGLTLLTGGPQDAPGRQQSWRGALDWSVARLSPAERTLFLRLAVLPGPWAFAAAAAVADPSPPADLLALLTSLVDKNFLRQYEDPETGTQRFGMLETIRAYAWDRLDQQGDLASLQRLQALHYLHQVETPALLPDGSPALVWLQQLAPEHANLCAALDWATLQDPALAGRLSTAVWEQGVGTMVGAYLVAHWLRS